MQAAPPPPQIDDGARLGATLVLSLLVHGLLVLGIGFATEDAAPVMPTLDVILTETTSPLTQAQADFLAQASNQGGGEHEQTNRPREAQIGQVPQDTTGVAPMELRAQSPDAQPPPLDRVVASTRGETALPVEDPTTQTDPSTLPRGPEKIERDLEMARLAAEIHMRSERYARRPKRKFVSASTQEYAYAAYLRQWVDRVERVGNLNYPDEARRRQLAGELVISVAIRRDGSVERADIIRSSGTAMLDDAALRIARLAEPYPPLPATGDEIDVLHVTRTWNFLPAGELIDDR
ncbi:energy transducer TonB [Luteimonas fraxinea]|uniref:Energy transducer TonB n=1 Tax=Luteimonas fraxinea TaxID=2901869 RepID=A0ABS8U8F9_9GAMM|nr:energy transducer TonB [Luteimonas fraxinea]MCD9095858.1 energy transducer TonB [Luteimonas fraxinea]MCD9124447.1 energy transducer TonB [Luteimonas fraxinea]UHH10963.1 energy transducer TonB [Luteimonas fraxinea]